MSVALIGYAVSHIALLFIIIFIAGFAMLVGSLLLMPYLPVIIQFHFVLQG